MLDDDDHMIRKAGVTPHHAACMVHVQALSGGEMSSAAAAPALPAPPSVQEMAMQDAPAGAPAMPPEPDTSTGISPDARVPASSTPILCITHFIALMCEGHKTRVLGAADPEDRRKLCHCISSVTCCATTVLPSLRIHDDTVDHIGSCQKSRQHVAEFTLGSLI